MRGLVLQSRHPFFRLRVTSAYAGVGYMELLSVEVVKGGLRVCGAWRLPMLYTSL